MVSLLIFDDFSTSKIPIQNSKFVTQNSKTASVRKKKSRFLSKFDVPENKEKWQNRPI